MRYLTLLAVVCTAVVAFDQRSNDVQVMPMHPIASTTDFVHFKNRVLTAPGKANQANNPRGKYERSGFKNGGRVGAFVGATAGAIGGTVGGAAAGTAIAGPAGGVVGAAFGVTSGIYAGTPLGRQAGAKIGGAGGRVIDKIAARRDAKAPPQQKKLSRSKAITPSRAQPTETKTTPSKATAEKRPGIFSRAKESIKTSLRNAVTPTAKKMFGSNVKAPRPPPAGRTGASQAGLRRRNR
ncbi:hypothetical protein AC1031_012355 [Aphanomyces cochlioides]|nr:hypothetical protein AC1031_012355 [Aphanomyces cochlioides]